MNMLSYIISLLIAYLLGNISTSYIIAKFGFIIILAVSGFKPYFLAISVTRCSESA